MLMGLKKNRQQRQNLGFNVEQDADGPQKKSAAKAK